MSGSKKTEYEIALQVGGKVAASFGNSVSEVNAGFDRMTSMAKTAAKMITTTFAAIKVGQFFGDAIETYSQFEQSMANTAAIANATESEYRRLEAAAREMGKATTKTATEASDALGYMMLAGWDVEDAISGLEPVLRLAEATQMDLARCSDLVTDSMSALGLSVEGLSEYLDLCTAANNNANTTAEALMEAFIGCGGAAKTVGADLNDVATALGVLANNGTKGAQAGTAMNAILVRMTSKDVALKAMRNLGVEVFNSAGEFRGLETVLIDVQNALSGLTAEKQTAYMSDIAGTNYYTEMGYLLDAVKLSTQEVAESSGDVDGAWEALAKTADKNISAWDSLSASLEQSDGALMNMADTVTDTLQGAFSRLDSAADDAKISLADAFSDELKDLINGLAEYIPTLTQKFIDFAAKAAPKISGAFKTVKEVGGETWEILSAVGGWVSEHSDGVIQFIAGVGGAFTAYKVVSGLTGTANAMIGVGKAIKSIRITNPWLFGITAAITAITGITSAIKTAEKQAAKSNLAEHFGDIALSMNDISEVAGYIIGSGDLNKIHESMAAFGELDGIADSMQRSIDTVNKMNWKVSVGTELSADEQESYRAEIQNYIAQAQSYVEQEQYALNINLAMFAEGDLERQNIVDQLNTFYAGKYSELQELGTQLNEAVTEAFQDGLLDPDEAEVIANLQADMAKIQEALATSDFDAKLKVMELQYSGADLDPESFRALQEELGEQAKAAAAEYEESLQLRIANYQVMLEDGAIDQTQYDTAVNEFWEDYQEKMEHLELKSLDFQLNTITQTYGDEIDAFYEHMGDIFQKSNLDDYASQWESQTGQMLDGIWQNLYNNDIDKSTKQAIEMLLESMQPSLEQIEELKETYAEAGKELPAEMLNSLSKVDVLSAMTARKKMIGTAGDTQSVWKVMWSQIVNNPDYEELENFLREKGWELPEAMAEEVETAQDRTIAPAIYRTYNRSQKYVEEIFSPGFSVSAEVKVDLKPSYLPTSFSLPNIGAEALEIGQKISSVSPLAMGTKALEMGRKLEGHAEGGIFDTPHVAWFAEEGPEAIIPLDGSSHAVSLWEKVGQLLGIFEGGQNRSAVESVSEEISSYQTINNNKVERADDTKQFIFSPQITIEGSASKEDVKEAFSMSMEQFKEMMEQYFAEKARTAFG